MAILKVVMLAVGLILFVIFGLAIQILLKKDRKFPNTHIGIGKYLKSRGVIYAQTFDKME